jgi:HSP20 family molecular chaperone IbpA
MSWPAGMAQGNMPAGALEVAYKEATMIKINKESGLTPARPYAKSLKTIGFLDRAREFETAVMRLVHELLAPGFYALPWQTLNREFESVFGNEFGYGRLPIEVTETESELVVRAEVPGFEEKEIGLSVDPERVYIGAKHGEVTGEKMGKTVYSEHYYNEIGRTVELPAEINPDKVKAVLNNGILEITLLKAQAAKKVPIAVKAA